MKIKYLAFVLSIILLFCAFVVSVSAEPIDFDRKGSIAITVKCGDKSVTSGSFTIYRVATFKWNVDKYDFIYTEQFSDCGIGFENLDSNITSKNYANFVKQSSIEGTTQPINEYGVSMFTDLSVGLYLVVQQDFAEGYTPPEPFLITLPSNGDDGLVYEINASPKLQIELDQIKPPPDIPQTGQLKWPIPVLAISGVVLFSLGWMLMRSKRKSN